MTPQHPNARPAALAIGLPLLLFAALTVVLAVHGWTPLPVESALHDWALTHRPRWAVTLVGVVTDLGIGIPPYLAAGTAGLLLASKCPRPRQRGTWIALACAPPTVLAVGQLVRNLLMKAFARPRPPVADWVAASPSGYSYPSGHAFTSAVAAGLLIWALLRGSRHSWRGPAVVALGAAAVAVGLSRVYLGVHWLLDITGAWALAAIWLALAVPLLGRLPFQAKPETTRHSTVGGVNRLG